MFCHFARCPHAFPFGPKRSRVRWPPVCGPKRSACGGPQCIVFRFPFGPKRSRKTHLPITRNTCLCERARSRARWNVRQYHSISNVPMKTRVLMQYGLSSLRLQKRNIHTQTHTHTHTPVCVHTHTPHWSCNHPGLLSFITHTFSWTRPVADQVCTSRYTRYNRK